MIFNQTAYFGRGAIREIPVAAKARGFKKAFIVTDPVLLETGTVAKATAVLDEAGLPYEIFDNVKPNPPVECIQDGVKKFASAGADFLIGLGGGSPQDTCKGIGIVTADSAYLLPTTANDSPQQVADFEFRMDTGELSAQIPQQGWQYLCQIEFRFDYFMGDMDITLVGVDQFGRDIKVKKHISHGESIHNLREYMRVDLRLQSYKLIFEGTARFRMTHFMAKLYTMSNRVGLVWGFDDSVSHRSAGDVHPTFKDYNDIRKAIIV